MPRKQKTYQTSQGFFDLAIAVPSMKVALEAWGSETNLFHKGFAFESDDPRVIEATMERPGVTLKRPVGTHEPLCEHAHLPKDLPTTAPSVRRPKAAKKKHKSGARKLDTKAARKAALAYEREKRKREKQRRKQEASDAKKRARRDKATAKIDAQSSKAESRHQAIAWRIAGQREKLDAEAEAEETCWQKEKDKLEKVRRRARGWETLNDGPFRFAAFRRYPAAVLPDCDRRAWARQ